MTEIIDLKAQRAAKEQSANAVTDFEASRVCPCTRCTVCDAYLEDCEPAAVSKPYEHDRIVVCEQCIKDRDFDVLLELNAHALECQAKFRRELIGRLQVPTLEQWKRAVADADADMPF